MSRIDILWSITTDYLVHFFHNKIEVTKMPKMFAHGQRVALDAYPTRLGRIADYTQHPTSYLIQFDDGELSHWLTAGAIREVPKGAPAAPESLKIGDRVVRALPPHLNRDLNPKAGVLLGIDEQTGEAWVRLDVPNTMRLGYGEKTPQFHTQAIRLACLTREPPKPLAVGDMVLTKGLDLPYPIIAIHGDHAWLGGGYGGMPITQPLTALVRA